MDGTDSAIARLKRAKVRRRKIVRMFKMGTAMADIAKQLGITRQRVDQVLRAELRESMYGRKRNEAAR